MDAYKTQTGGAASEKTKILVQIAEYEKKLSVAKDLLVAEKIDVEDYNMMKIANSTILKSLERELAEVSSVKEDIEIPMNQWITKLLMLRNNIQDSTLAPGKRYDRFNFP